MKTNSLLIKLSKYFPKKIAKQYHDYVGLMCGKLKNDTNKVLICLDFDDEVLPYVKSFKPDIVFTHHPFIYGRKSYVLKNDLIKKRLYDEMLSLNVPIYSMHTNFDAGKGGMNDTLMRLLDVKNIHRSSIDPMMCIANLNHPLSALELSKQIKNAFDVDYGLLVCNDNNKTINTIALIAGGGSRSWQIAKEENADMYISGDAPHHVRRDIINNNYCYLDLPHEIEKIFMPRLKEILLKIDEKLEILIVDHEKLPCVI